MALQVTALVCNDYLSITATSLGGSLVGVTKHHKNIGLSMSSLAQKFKHLAVEKNFISVTDNVRLIGKNGRILEGNTVLWVDAEFNHTLGKELVAKRCIIKCKMDPRVFLLGRYIEAGA